MNENLEQRKRVAGAHYSKLFKEALDTSDKMTSSLLAQETYIEYLLSIWEKDEGFCFDLDLPADELTIVLTAALKGLSGTKLMEKIVSYPWVDKAYLERKKSQTSALALWCEQQQYHLIERCLDLGVDAEQNGDMSFYTPIRNCICSMVDMAYLEHPVFKRLLRASKLKDKPELVRDTMSALIDRGGIEKVKFLINYAQIDINSYTLGRTDLSRKLDGPELATKRISRVGTLIENAVTSRDLAIMEYFIVNAKDKKLILTHIQKEINTIKHSMYVHNDDRFDDRDAMLHKYKNILSEKVMLSDAISADSHQLNKNNAQEKTNIRKI